MPRPSKPRGDIFARASSSQRDLFTNGYDDDDDNDANDAANGDAIDDEPDMDRAVAHGDASAPRHERVLRTPEGDTLTMLIATE